MSDSNILSKNDLKLISIMSNAISDVLHERRVHIPEVAGWPGTNALATRAYHAMVGAGHVKTEEECVLLHNASENLAALKVLASCPVTDYLGLDEISKDDVEARAKQHSKLMRLVLDARELTGITPESALADELAGELNAVDDQYLTVTVSKDLLRRAVEVLRTKKGG